MTPNDPKLENRNWLAKIVWLILLLVGGLAFVWLVIVRIVAKLHGGEPCPFALARLVDNPLRQRYMAQLLDCVGIQPGERVLELGPGPGAFTIEAARQLVCLYPQLPEASVTMCGFAAL